jgi:alpha/beta superfamily hydrolase
MCNLFGHKGNANQNDIEIPPHPSQNGYHQEHKQQQMLARMWRKKNTSTLLVEM